MKQELFDKLKIKFPQTFKELSYIECDDGWFNIIYSLANTIEIGLGDLDPEMSEQMYAIQIKQKFGTLRVYMSHSDHYIDGAIRMAEYMSAKTCETCGAKSEGTKSMGGWISVKCTRCYNKEMKARRLAGAI